MDYSNLPTSYHWWIMSITSRSLLCNKVITSKNCWDDDGNVVLCICRWKLCSRPYCKSHCEWGSRCCWWNIFTNSKTSIYGRLFKCWPNCYWMWIIFSYSHSNSQTINAWRKLREKKIQLKKIWINSINQKLTGTKLNIIGKWNLRNLIKIFQNFCINIFKSP